MLYRNLANGIFEDVTTATGAGDGCFPHVKWGGGLVDFDNDGDRDLFIACGHLQDNVEQYERTTAYEVPQRAAENTGGRFVNVSDSAGGGLLPRFSSRGAAFDDLDNDGDVDVVILNARDRANVLRNDSPRAITACSWSCAAPREPRRRRDASSGHRRRLATGG